MAATKSSPGSASGANMSYHNLPASPTLTNPDMILPDYDYDCAASPDRERLPPAMWKENHHPSDLQFSLGSQGFVAGPITPTTPIIYGNGTMLSDIGEVTEVESTVGKSSLPRSRRLSVDSIDGLADNHALRSSPTMGYSTGPYEGVKERARKMNVDRERRSSMESTSTITTQEHNKMFADFDDAVSVDDSNFQGDDEESMASSYHYDYYDEPQTKQPELDLKTRPSNATLRSEDRYSTASLSKRAEEILANAKKRLTVRPQMSHANIFLCKLTMLHSQLMEGNLSRARSINHIRSPLSTSSSTIGSSSPPLDRPATAIENEMPSSAAEPLGYNRQTSENISLTNEIKAGIYPRRSASALGAAGGYRQPLHTLQTSRSFDHIRDRDNHMRDSLSGGFKRANVKATSPHEPALSPLTEDEISSELHPDEDDGAKLDSFLSPTFGTFNPAKQDMPRASSAAQVRDLKDQMKGLKGKISSLRQQARADSMKRRSLQSLRTPSPFTHAPYDPWAEQKSLETAEATVKPEEGRKSWNAEVEGASQRSDPTKYDSPESVISETPEFRGGLSPPKRPVNSGPVASSAVSAPRSVPEPIEESSEEEFEDANDVEDMRTEDGNQDSDQDDFNSAYESESGESVYHDSVPQQMSHEDREDAFDYEHFFLHSAMGSMSQARLRRTGRTNSFSSEDSVETTKGPTASSTKPPRPSVDPMQAHTRSDSVVSTSTIESFATAAESRHSTIFEDAIENYPEQVVSAPAKTRTSQATPATAKRTSFSLPVSSGASVVTAAGRSSLDEQRSHHERQNSVIRRPNTSQATYMHRKSISSFESTGTTRSFPLVNKPKANANGMLTPQGSPDSELRTIRDSLMSDTVSVCDAKGPAPIDTLGKEDQILVQRLVESLGKCVLGLTDHGRASPEARMCRRRIDAARKILDGSDETF
ncbi:hypothetical protein MKZ38_003117 [Zalerion maritima]|uniref:Uncharacterized protein n=1 Tax=Zalerion maritima TaxID=339359 RepID=A0AAD5RX48_9PEZI|nr:hypothetical protein MKZ38_003117 [Zalerion maritima]